MSSNLENGEESEYHFERLFNVSWALKIYRRKISRPLLDIVFNLTCMRSAVHEYLFYAGVCQKFERVFNERGVCKREEALVRLSAIAKQSA